MVELYFHLKKTTKRMLYGILLFVFTLTLTSSREPTTLEDVLNDGELRIVTLMGSTTYFEHAKGKDGFDYLLAKAFADSLGVRLKVTTMPSLNGVLLAIGGPKAHMAAAGLTVTSKRQKTLRFSDPYYQVVQKVLYRNGSKRPRKIEDLFGGTLLAIPNSSHSERLSSLANKYPELQWQEPEGLEMQDLMSLVHSGKVSYAVIDSTVYYMDQGIFPKARAAFDLSDPEPIAWAFPLHGDTSLIDAANAFIADYKKNGQLKRLEQQALKQLKRFNLAASQLFLRQINNRLPKYQAIFQQVAKQYGLDWHLVAAISYQESHWNAKAKSPTGVRGLMMLTRPTAKEMGVTDRLDPKQSIEGGVRYFLKTKSRIPSDITEPDRTLLALAAYNVGLGHLEDARVLTDRAGKDPDNWENVKEFLPLLQKKKYYSTVRHGYARGQEPVKYVSNILYYQSILKKNTSEKKRRQEQQKPTTIPNSSDWEPGSLLSL